MIENGGMSVSSDLKHEAHKVFDVKAKKTFHFHYTDDSESGLPARAVCEVVVSRG